MPRGAVAQAVAQNMKSASWIREMFEKGRRLKAEFGDETVCDFSLGNPTAGPPAAFLDAVEACARERDPTKHRYMPNAGFDETRAAVAGFIANEYRLDITPDSVIITCGAAGGLNVVLRSICDPGDEVIVLAPYFPEYKFYITQANAEMVLVQTDRDFQPDIPAIEAAVCERTRAILVNSPNNPSGAIHTAEKCRALGELCGRFDRDDRPLYLVTDDPYRRIIYELDWCPTPVHFHHRTIIVSSYSKDLGIPGERAGYIGVPARTPEREPLLGALTMLNRTLGYVNAPAFTQRVLARCANEMCDLSGYRANRDRLCGALRDFGYELPSPGGAFYAFPKTPIADDAAFADLLLEQRILAVPGRGFGRPGHIRLSYAVVPEVIERSLAGFKSAIEQVR